MFSLRSPRVLVPWLVMGLTYLPWTTFAAPPAFVNSPWVFVCGIGLFWAMYFAWPLAERAFAKLRRP